jgi:hypothetical protein
LLILSGSNTVDDGEEDDPAGFLEAAWRLAAASPPSARFFRGRSGCPAGNATRSTSAAGILTARMTPGLELRCEARRSSAASARLRALISTHADMQGDDAGLVATTLVVPS